MTEEHVNLQICVTARGILAMVASERFSSACVKAMLPGATLVHWRGLEHVIALHVLCQVVVAGRAIEALGAVKQAHHTQRHSLVCSHVRPQVLPSSALKVVFLAFESHLFDTQRPDIKFEIFLKFEKY